MNCQLVLAIFPFSLFLWSCILEGTWAGPASCRKVCRNVGVQLKASAKPSAVVQAQMDQQFRAMSQSMEALQITRDAQISRILSTIQELKTEIKNTREALCPLLFNGKCYWTIFERDMNYTAAEKVCARIPNGKPSNIYGRDHLFIVLKYLRTLVRRNHVSVYAWIGMTIDPESEKVSFNNGQTPKTVKWKSNQPDFALDNTQLMIMARTDGNQKQEGLYNQNPAHGKPAVLCEA